MVALEAQQLLPQGLHLGLQVRLAQGQLIQDPAQAAGVGLHQLPHGQLRLVPGQGQGQPLRLEALELLALLQPSLKLMESCPQRRAGRGDAPVPPSNSLGPEVVCSQLGVIDVHDYPGVLCLGAQNLGAKAREGGNPG